MAGISLPRKLKCAKETDRYLKIFLANGEVLVGQVQSISYRFGIIDNVKSITILISFKEGDMGRAIRKIEYAGIKKAIFVKS